MSSQGLSMLPARSEQHAQHSGCSVVPAFKSQLNGPQGSILFADIIFNDGSMSVASFFRKNTKHLSN
jgi:hypothetical protein